MKNSEEMSLDVLSIRAIDRLNDFEKKEKYQSNLTTSS